MAYGLRMRPPPMPRTDRSRTWMQPEALPRTAAVLAFLMAAAACERADKSQTSGSVEATGPASKEARVEVNRDGFAPDHIEIGPDRRVTFRRTSDDTCATAVVVPKLNVRKALPLNEDVVVELPPTASGELALQCGVGMHKGSVVVQ